MVKRNIFSRYLSVEYVIVILLFVFTVFIFAPFELFFASIHEFWFSVYDLLPFAMLGLFGGNLLAIIGFGMLNKLCPKMAQILLVLLFGLTLCLYIQGNFIIGDYGLLDGEKIDWGAYPKDAAISIFLWMGIIVLLCVWLYKAGYEKIKSPMKIISICILLVQMVTLLTVGIVNNGFRKEEMVVSTIENQFKYSPEQNLIVLVLDSVDSQVFSELLDGDKGSEYKEILSDFTYYRNTVGNYVYTDLSSPQIVTGINYSEGQTYQEYVNKAYQESALLNKLENEDWEINIYTPTETPQDDYGIDVDNFESVELTVSSRRRLAEYMYRLIGLRYLPFHLKQYCWFYPDDMKDMRDAEDSTMEIYTDSNIEFYNKIDTMSVGSEEDMTFHFYHLEGAHIPYTLNRNLEETDSETSIEEEVMACMRLIDKYLSALKENNVYEQSAIVILADHGYCQERQAPMLLVKGVGEENAFSITEAPVSFEDLQEGFIELMLGKNAKEIFPVKEGEDRIRKFYYYTRDYSNDITEQTFKIREYEIEGHAFENNTMTVTKSEKD